MKALSLEHNIPIILPNANQMQGSVLLLNENSSIISKLPAHQAPVFVSIAICFGGKLKMVFWLTVREQNTSLNAFYVSPRDFT